MFLGTNASRQVSLRTLPPPVSREKVRASTSHNPMGLHGLLTGKALPLFCLLACPFNTKQQWVDNVVDRQNWHAPLVTPLILLFIPTIESNQVRD
jgi:hypothetical protein